MKHLEITSSNPKPHRLLSLAAVTLTAAALLGGCASSAGYKKADATGAGIAAFRDDIVKVKVAVDSTMAALGDISEQANVNPRKPFESYSKAVSELDSSVARAKKQAEDMKTQGAAYFAQWEKELSTVSNPEIRNLAQERKTKLSSTFSQIQGVTQEAKASFDPWHADVKDLQKYLANDLSIGGIDAAKDLIKKTTLEGGKVQQSLDAVIAELNTVAAQLTPAKLKTK